MVTLSTSLSFSIFPYLNFLPQLKPKNNTLVLHQTLSLAVAYDSTELDLQWFDEQPVQTNEDIDNFDLVPEFDLTQTSHTRLVPEFDLNY